MPNSSQHLYQYNKNKNLAKCKILQETKYRDWKITVIFYAIMHLMDSSYADTYPQHKTHQKRKNFISKVAPYKNIAIEYEELERLSRRSRYDCIPIEAEEVEQAEEIMEYIENFLKNLKASAS